MMTSPHSAMQNVWTFSIAIDNHTLGQALTELAERITAKQDECHNIGMLATITAISHDVCNLYGQGDILSAVVTVNVTPLSVTGSDSPEHLVERVPEP